MKRDGRMLLELLVIMPLLGILGVALCSLFITQARVGRVARERVRAAETLRIAAAVLRAELHWAHPQRDVSAWTADSLRLRAVRGIALPCGPIAEPLRVSFAGLRQPDPDKDSVLLIGHAHETVHVLRAVRAVAPGCAAAHAGAAQLWSLLPPAATRGILLLFETGTYSLNDGALRYRVGVSGRQPITDELINSSASRFQPFGLTLSIGPADRVPDSLRFRPLNGSQ